MATITFEGYMGSSPDWTDLGANTLVFSSSLTDLATAVTVSSYQDGTHAGNGDPGTDQCGTNHMNNVKYLTSSTMSVDGAASEDITDANLATTECTLRLHFNHTGAVAVTLAKFYAFDGSTPTNVATGVTVYAFERGRSATTWTQINDGNTVGGNNTGERLDLADSGSATDHYWYIAISASPNSVGAKTSFDFGMTLTYS